MKTPKLIYLVAGLVGISLQVQMATGSGSSSASTGNSVLPRPTPYHVVERGANSSVWQRESYDRDPEGKIVMRIHKFTELCGNMHYLENNAWKDSQELIEPYSTGAIAQRGAYRVIFCNNLNSYGAIDMETVDHKRLTSNILGLGYYDSSTDQAVLVAQIKDCQGALLANNAVIYQNAFDGLDADVKYQYRKCTFSQEVILHTQPAPAAAFGLNPETTMLEVFTEFINPPPATVTPATGNSESLDENISWGATLLGKGRAFDLGNQGNQQTVPVTKRYITVQGRKVLVELVPLKAVANSLGKLPQQSGIQRKQPLLASSEAEIIPGVRKKAVAAEPIKLAANLPEEKGYLLDYTTLNLNEENYTFRADTTFLVTGDINLAGVTTIENGTVIKFQTNNNCSLKVLDSVRCNTENYSPAIFTSASDSAVGENLGSCGSSEACTGTLALRIQNDWGEDFQEICIYDANMDSVLHTYGSPLIASGNYADYSFSAQYGQTYYFYAHDNNSLDIYGEFEPRMNNAELVVDDDGNVNYSEAGDVLCELPPPPTVVGLSLAYGGNLSHVRFDNLAVGLETHGDVVLTDAQFINCGTALKVEGASLYAGNILMANVGTGFGGSSFTVRAENLTFDQGSDVAYSTSGTSSLCVTNSLLTSVSEWGNVSYRTNYTAWLDSNSGVYQTMGAGSYYLAAESFYRNAGTDEIDPWLLKELRGKTTCPPIVYENISLTETNYSPQAQRDTDAPDLGYHFAPLDYCFGSCTLPNNATFGAGTAVGCFESEASYGVGMGFGVGVTFLGTPAAPCILTHYSTVQDRLNGIWPNKGWLALFSAEGGAGNNLAGAARVNLRFTKMGGLANDPNFFRDDGCWIIVRATHSEFFGGSFGGYGIQFWLTDCLLDGTYLGLQSTDTANGVIAMQNCTLHRNIILAEHWSGATWPVILQNSAFDAVDYSQMDSACGDTNVATYNNNAFINGQGRLPIISLTDVVVSGGFNWQSNWLGRYYLPPGSQLINAGTTAIDPDLLAELVTMTTYAPQDGSLPDNDGQPDIGHHYPRPLMVLNPNFASPAITANQQWYFDATFCVHCQTPVGSDGVPAWYWLDRGFGAGGIGANFCEFFESSPVGTQAAFLQGSVSLVQSNLVVSSNGVYHIGFWAGPRVQTHAIKPANNLYVAIDNVTNLYIDATNLQALGIGFGLFGADWTLTSGVHVLQFIATTNAGINDSATIIAGVTIGPPPFNQSGTTNICNDCSYASVQAACAAASDGWTVIIPVGSCRWSNTVLVNKNINIQGAGIDLTVILDGLPAKVGNLLSWRTSATIPCRLTGITFAKDPGNIKESEETGSVLIYGGCTRLRVDHCQFDNLWNTELFLQDQLGVVDHCNFYHTGTGFGIKVRHPNWNGYTDGNGSWADADYWGTTNFMYVEDCVFTNYYGHCYALDLDAGGRLVFRFNSLTNDSIGGHGADSTGWERSMRVEEVYGNTFVWDDVAQTTGNFMTYIRGGTAVVCSNTFVNWNIDAALAAYRETVGPWQFGYVSGTNLYDLNNTNGTGTNGGILYTNGTASPIFTNSGVSINTLTDTNASWTINQWYGYSLIDMNGRASWITTNSEHTITCQPNAGYTGPYYVTFRRDEDYSIGYVYAAIDQPGRGQGDLMLFDGTAPSNTVTHAYNWPHEGLDPIYVWTNKLTITEQNPGGTGGGSQSPSVIVNRDWYNAPKPGWTPLPYPHPLAAP